MAVGKGMRRIGSRELGGFTIIEVILVLAIAGLIFLMVFIALPILNRSQRDTARQQSMASVETQIVSYQRNNDGKLPTPGSKLDKSEDPTLPACSSGSSSANKAAACFIRNYMNGANATENEFQDPSGWYYGIEFQNLTAGSTATLDEMDYIVHVYEHASCNGEEAVYSQNARDFAIMYKLEGSGTYCKDSK